jgi:hypothetical protein
MSNEVLPNGSGFEGLDEFQKQMQASHWAMLFLLAETAAGFHILVDRLSEKGTLDDEDRQAMDQALLNIDFMKANYAHINNAFQEKYNRVRFAAEHKDEVSDYVRDREEGKATTDPLTGREVPAKETTSEEE